MDFEEIASRKRFKNRPKIWAEKNINIGVGFGGKRKQEARTRTIKGRGMKSVTLPITEEEHLFYTEELRDDEDQHDDDEPEDDFENQPFDFQNKDNLTEHELEGDKEAAEKAVKKKPKGRQPLGTERSIIFRRGKKKMPEFAKKEIGMPQIWELQPEIKDIKIQKDKEITYADTINIKIGALGTIVEKSGRKTIKIGDPMRKRRLDFKPHERKKSTIMVMDSSSIVNASKFYKIKLWSLDGDLIGNTVVDMISEAILGETKIVKKVRFEKKISIREYLENEFQSWYHTKKYLKIEKIKKKGLKKLVRIAIAKLSDIESILDDLHRIFPSGDSLFFEMNAEEILKKIHNMRYEESDFQNRTKSRKQLMIKMDIHLSKLPQPQKIKGAKLADIIADIIAKYIEGIPAESTVYKEMLAHKVLLALKTRKFKREDKSLKKEFEGEHLKQLKKLYSKYDKEYKKSIKASTKTSPEELARKETLSSIDKFEESVWKSVGDTTLINYLSRALFPLLFLDSKGDIGKYANFFRSKIDVGSIEIKDLGSANLAHFIPEVVMKFIADKKSLQPVYKRLKADLKFRVDAFIAFYMGQQGIRVHYPRNLPVFSWSKYLIEPQEMCHTQTGTGYINGEKITDGDLIICYSNGKFYCYSANEIIRDIAHKNTKKYPASFVRKMSIRYSERIERIRKMKKN